MRLKSLELHGYKTFASRSEFQFSEKVTAIVGPNGSGKSNVADSLRWVLGEQSFSLLRGKKTEDMIFAGSEHRPRASMASATITFDNSEGWLPIDFTEVAITRRAYRDGENEYLLNGQRVRLRDVSELLAKSGLAERTYTIIGQGLVDTALSLKADERRRLFEEAAGIGLYRTRREEALRRLDTTRHNLERVQDILAELQPRLRSLERAARRAQEYEQIKGDLRLLLRDWYGFHWHRSQEELAEAREAAHQQEDALEDARRAYAGLDERLSASRDQISGLRARLNSWHRQLSQLHARRETVSRDLAVADERARSLLEQQQSIQAEIARLAEEFTLHQERLQAALQETQARQAELDEARAQVQAVRKALQERQAERALVEEDLHRTRQNLSGLTGRQGQLQARLAERQAQAQRQQETLKAAGQAVTAAEQDVTAADLRWQAAGQARRAAEEKRQAAEAALQAHRERLAEADTLRKRAFDVRSAAQAEVARLRAQAEVLEQAERSLTGYGSGAKLLLEAARQAQIKGVRGALSSLLEVPAEYETAVSAALGEYLDAVVLADGADVDSALERLAGQTARAALLPVDGLVPAALPAHADSAIGLASNLVQAAPELRPAVDLLLGQTWVVADRAAARSILVGRRQDAPGDAPPALRAVTLQGEVFHASGPVIAGLAGKGGTLGRTRQRREVQEKLAAAEKSLVEAEMQAVAAEQALAALQADGKRLQQELDATRTSERNAINAAGQEDLNLEKARRQLAFQREQQSRLGAEISRAETESRQMSEEIAQFDAKIQQARERLRALNAALAELSLEEFQAQAAHWNTRAAVIEQAVTDAQNRQRERQAALDGAHRSQSGLEKRLGESAQALSTLEQEKENLRQDEAAANEEIEALQALIEPAEAELSAVEQQQESLQTVETGARQVLSQAEHRHAQAKIMLARRQEALDSLRGRIEDDFGLVAFEYVDEVSGPTPLPLQGMVEALPILKELPAEIEENIKRQRAQLRRMGPINPDAQIEFEEVQQRFDFLNTQMTDLHEAEASIKEVIAELDVLMQREFRKTFDAVAYEFRQTFTRLFGGGSARLVLTDPEDLTNTGIDIEARLPGRREQGLSLLSGGERSLTAVALVFSLLKVSPTPFCVLDEVDAMLDEANVGRFRDLLAELGQTTQFAVITHNRNTVQVADVIYGITMGRDSASQAVSLKLDEVSQVVS
ncbi:MAG: chromosome segregation protein SMC [Chloroflexota bacterium]